MRVHICMKLSEEKCHLVKKSSPVRGWVGVRPRACKQKNHVIFCKTLNSDTFCVHKFNKTADN